ncbi:uncharacterized protein PRCAT00000726001 [Priceomyces carsonii]|uniref:uncharacterized protein n=1 Tax=Priceomyces carsonii TaxID=28549 RepID=UPI002EDB5B86|nr:unnamed protein product [Priceomyces carsonii]
MSSIDSSPQLQARKASIASDDNIRSGGSKTSGNVSEDTASTVSNISPARTGESNEKDDGSNSTWHKLQHGLSGFRSFLGNLNYISDNIDYLNERVGPSSPESDPDRLEEYLQIGTESINGFTLLLQMASLFELSIQIYHAIENKTERTVLVRLSPNMNGSLSFSGILNEWYILSGLNPPNKHRLWTNEHLDNDYLPKEDSIDFDCNRPDFLAPVTLPRGIKGILYPSKIAYCDEEVEDETSQKRFALIYDDFHYKSLKDIHSNLSIQGNTEMRGGSSVASSVSSDSIVVGNNNLSGSYLLGVSNQTLNGTNLTNRLFEDIARKAKQSPKSPLKVIEIISDMIQLLKPLATVHEFGIVHNGITSSNILKSTEKASNVVLTGWDFCFSLQPEDSSNGYRKRHLAQVPDLLPYISPEATGEINKSVDYRSDFYGIGIVLYELLVGCLPFVTDSDPSRLIRMHILQKPIAPHLICESWISETLSNIIMKLLEKNASDRYSDCNSLINDLVKVKNSYIDNILQMSHSVSQYWSNDEKTKEYLLKEPYFHPEKNHIPPSQLLPRKLVGREQDYKNLINFYYTFGSYASFIFIKGPSGVGKSALMNDLTVEAISSRDYYCHWKFERLESGNVYNFFLHSMKTIINQILNSSNHQIQKMNDLIISNIPLDLGILFRLIPELKTLLGPKYSGIYERTSSSVDTDNNKSEDHTFNLDLKFRYILKAFFCVIGLQGLTIFLDDLHYCSMAEWSMISEFLDYARTKNSKGNMSIRIVTTYDDLHKNSDNSLNIRSIYTFLKTRDAQHHVLNLKYLERSKFGEYINAVSTVNPRHQAGPSSYDDTTSSSSMLNKLKQNGSSEQVQTLSSKLFAMTKGNILITNYLLRIAGLTGNIKLDASAIPSDMKWLFTFSDKILKLKQSEILKTYLTLAVPNEAISLLKFAALSSPEYYFYLSDLIIVSDLSMDDVFKLLNLCVETKIIVPTRTYYKLPFHLMMSSKFPIDISDSGVWMLATQTRYRFSHDDIRAELLEQLNSSGDLEQYHRLCGLRHYKRIKNLPDFSIRYYLKMAAHFSGSWKVAKDDEEHIYLEVLLAAGRYASSTYSVKDSLKFFEIADKFIKPRDKKRKVKSAFTLCQCNYYLKDYRACLKIIDSTNKLYSFSETLFLTWKVRSLFRLGETEKGILVAVEGLQKVGFDASLDESINVKAGKEALKSIPLSVAEIRNLRLLPLATDPDTRLAYELICDMIAPTYILNKRNLRTSLVRQLITAMNTRGVSSYCAIPLLEFANNLAKENDKASFSRCIQFCEFALELVSQDEKVSFAFVKSVYEIYISLLAIFIEPIGDVFKYYDTFISSTKALGYQSSSLDIVKKSAKLYLLYYTGHPLDQILASCDNSSLVSNYHLSNENDFLLAVLHLLQSQLNVDDLEKIYENLDQKSSAATFSYYNLKTLYFTITGRLEEAEELLINHAYHLLQDLSLSIMHIDFYCLAAFVLCQSKHRNESTRQAIFDKAYKLFEVWNEMCPSTFAPKFLLVKALKDIYENCNSSLSILDTFEESIELAKESGSWYDVAWGSLQCAIWLKRTEGSRRRISSHAKVALETFRSLKATLLVEAVERSFSNYLNESYNWAGLTNKSLSSGDLTKSLDKGRGMPLNNSLNSFFTSSDYTKRNKIKIGEEVSQKMRVRRLMNNERDSNESLNRAVQACLAISESYDNDLIVLNLLESTIILSDVDYGAVVVKSENEPFIKAVGSPNNVYGIKHQPLSSRNDLCPFSLLTYVMLTGEFVNKDEDHILFEKRFGKDEYFLQNTCAAMICIPLKNQAGVYGALYLEKNGGSKVRLPYFGAKKRDLLNLLCSQTAISLGKAILYSQMEVAKKAAEEATAEKASFLANMSHEIRTPFNSLLSCSMFLLDTPLNMAQREYVETIKSSALVTLNIIDGILAFSKIEHGSFTLENAPFSLNDCIESALQLACEQAAANDLELVFFNRCQNIKNIFGDLTRFRQIIINLVGNSVKFTQDGHILVEVNATKITSDRYRIHVSVEDTGIGIPDESKSKVFGAFSQADGSSRREFGGSGLGLTISKKLADLMGGSLTFETCQNEGSVFHLVLNTQVELLKEPEITLSGKEGMFGFNNAALILDRRVLSREALREMLTYFGMSVTVSTTDKADKDDLKNFSLVIAHQEGFSFLKDNMRQLHKDCKIIVVAQFGNLLSKEIESYPVLLYPFQKQKIINMINGLKESSENLSLNLSTFTEALKSDSLLSERYPLRILLAEDNLVNIKVALQHLKKLGYDADHAKDGVEVIVKCESLLEKDEKYDVILMDIQMPRKDGLSATIELRELFDKKNKSEYVPMIVALTANVAGEDREKSLGCGMVDFISKPILPSELKRVLSAVGENLK